MRVKPGRIQMGRLGLILLLAVLLATIGMPGAAGAGSWVTGTYSGSAGNRSWKLFVPTGYQTGQPVPLVMMLHGCTQDADTFEAGTRMSLLAESNKFLVVYPIQPSSVDSNKCWQWFKSAHQARGSGEPAILKGIVDQIKANYSVDAGRVYVAGLSAGGAMTAIMAATYPDVFAAAAVHSGLEYKASTTDSSAAWNVMRVGGPDPKQQGKLAYQASGSAHRVVPTIVFHGRSDYTVYPVNGDQSASQSLWMNDWADDGSNNASTDDTAEQTVPGQVSGGYAYTRYIYKDSRGMPAGEKWLVESMGHAWSGGSTNGSYTDPKGPDASSESWRFFSQFPQQVTPTGPVVSASPPPGAYGGTLSVSLSANQTGTTIRYTTDGTEPSLSSPVYAGPLAVTGSMTVKAKGWSASGTAGTTSTFAYTVAPITVTASPAGGTFEGPTDVSLSMNMPGSIYYTTDGSAPTTASPVYTGPVRLTCSTCPVTHTLRWLGQDRAGNTGGTGTATYTINTPPATSTVNFYPVASEEGYMYEGGAALPNSTNGYLELGDTGMNKGERILLSFDTSAIPDTATVVSASLTLYRYNNLYFNARGFGAIKADVKAGCFNGNCAVETADYTAAAGADGVISIVNIPIMDRQTAYGEMAAGGLAHVSRTGRTQLRVRFEYPTNSNYSLDALRLYSAEALDQTVRPILTVTYR